MVNKTHKNVLFLNIYSSAHSLASVPLFLFKKNQKRGAPGGAQLADLAQRSVRPTKKQ